ncbi:hypothetical protein N656DRAFT_304173 [Canariomyces notabilis]|uniref:Uncharacterized protein n=1 Tax=Canariomyces notabilis TaxID=2074819 RepID=A0AAN6QH78_9PEZI|nr:hypothetical protein N656DRAFT_304173 [Canariomyces arenarius]
MRQAICCLLRLLSFLLASSAWVTLADALATFWMKEVPVLVKPSDEIVGLHCRYHADVQQQFQKGLGEPQFEHFDEAG